MAGFTKISGLSYKVKFKNKGIWLTLCAVSDLTQPDHNKDVPEHSLLGQGIKYMMVDEKNIEMGILKDNLLIVRNKFGSNLHSFKIEANATGYKKSGTKKVKVTKKFNIYT